MNRGALIAAATVIFLAELLFWRGFRAKSGTGQGATVDSWWQEIVNMLVSEFSDLPSATEFARTTLRLAIAATLGGILGLEREHRGKAAGVRTHMLVAVGAALFVLIPQQMQDRKSTRLNSSHGYISYAVFCL